MKPRARRGTFCNSCSYIQYTAYARGRVCEKVEATTAALATRDATRRWRLQNRARESAAAAGEWFQTFCGNVRIGTAKRSSIATRMRAEYPAHGAASVRGSDWAFVPSSTAVPGTGKTLSYFKGMLTRLFYFVVRITVVISIFGGFIWYMTKSDDDREAARQAAVAPYNAQVSRYLKKNFVAEGRLPAKGKIIVIDGNTNSSDKFLDSNLGKERQPTSPNEVDSVVLHKCRYDQVGSYSNGSRALQQVCAVDVIDVATGGWSSWGEFQGTAPPSEIKRKRGSTSDEKGGSALYGFYSAGGLERR